METKTESNTMTNDDLMMMTNIQLVERNYMMLYYNYFMSTKWAESLRNPNGDTFQSEKGVIYFYTKQAVVLRDEQLKSYSWNFRDNIDDKDDICFEEIKKNDVYNFYTFYTSSVITCMITGILNKRRTYYDEEYIEEVPLYIWSEDIDFCGKPCILTIDDFTEDFKTKSLWIVSENDLNINDYDEHISIGDKVRMMAEMNNQKHRKNFETQNQVQEQSKLIASLQQQVDLLRLEREVQEQRNKEQMTLMQKQLREQSKLIASLQSHLVVNKKEVEVDMFADWLND